MKTILAELHPMATQGHALEMGKVFESVVQRILETARQFRSQFKNVWLWDDYPDRGGGSIIVFPAPTVYHCRRRHDAEVP